ncbi:hypothetical protein BD413DRAFT_210026 [Trametes elegans]|nr:hypothetical protein BD413DRAFT_210026 [Trametes elegans]
MAVSRLATSRLLKRACGSSCNPASRACAAVTNTVSVWLTDLRGSQRAARSRTPDLAIAHTPEGMNTHRGTVPRCQRSRVRVCRKARRLGHSTRSSTPQRPVATKNPGRAPRGSGGPATEHRQGSPDGRRVDGRYPIACFSRPPARSTMLGSPGASTDVEARGGSGSRRVPGRKEELVVNIAARGNRSEGPLADDQRRTPAQPL